MGPIENGSLKSRGIFCGGVWCGTYTRRVLSPCLVGYPGLEALSLPALAVPGPSYRPYLAVPWPCCRPYLAYRLSLGPATGRTSMSAQEALSLGLAPHWAHHPTQTLGAVLGPFLGLSGLSGVVASGQFVGSAV